MKAKLLIGISAALVAGLGGYYLYKTKFAKKQDEETQEETPEETPAPVKPVTTKPTVKPAPKTDPPRANPGFVQPPTGPVSVATKTPAMGAKIFALSASGANAYNSAKASKTTLYQYYKKGGYIGTFLGKEGSFAKIVVLDKGIKGMAGGTKVVFVPAKDIEATSK